MVIIAFRILLRQTRAPGIGPSHVGRVYLNGSHMYAHLPLPIINIDIDTVLAVQTHITQTSNEVA